MRPDQRQRESVPSSRFIANQSQPPPPTAMKSPHWWSNQAVPVTGSGRPPSVSVPARRHGRPRVVIRTAGRPEVDPAVAVVEGRRLGGTRDRGQPEPARRASPWTSGATDRPLRWSCPPPPAIVHGRRSTVVGLGRIEPASTRSKPVPSGRGGAVDLRPDLGPLAVEEPVARLVGDREMRRPADREAAALGAEDHVLEALMAARGVDADGPCTYHHSVSRSCGPSSRGSDDRDGDPRDRRRGRGSGRLRAGRRPGWRGSAPSRRPRRGGRDQAPREPAVRRPWRPVIGWPPRPRPRTPAGRPQALEPGRHPPVPVAEQPHRRRHEQRADDRRVEGDRDGHRRSRAP